MSKQVTFEDIDHLLYQYENYEIEDVSSFIQEWVNRLNEV